MQENNQPILEWNDDLSVKDEILDQQHQKLLRQLGVLSFSLRSGDGDEKLREILDFLEQYIVEHLRYEEKYMLRNEYPKYEEHRQTHTEFEEHFKEFKKKFYGDDVDSFVLAEEVEGYMRDWWINHINGEDRKYAIFIQDK